MDFSLFSSASLPILSQSSSENPSLTHPSSSKYSLTLSHTKISSRIPAKWLSLSCKSSAGEPVPACSPVQQLRSSISLDDICSSFDARSEASELPPSTVPERALLRPVSDSRCLPGYQHKPFSSLPSDPSTPSTIRLSQSATNSRIHKRSEYESGLHLGGKKPTSRPPAILTRSPRKSFTTPISKIRTS